MVMIRLVSIALLSAAAHSNAARVTGGLSGRVTYAGGASAAEPIDMSAEQYCADAHRPTPAARQRIRVGAQNGVADVIVHVKGVPANASRPVPSDPVVLDQKDCMYQPSILVLRAGQALTVRNSDDLLHNVHVRPSKNPQFNVGQPVAMESRRTLKVAELPIPVRCDIHDWMEATIAVFDDSFYAVTDADGRFTIEGLPAGDYEIEAWHPKLGLKSGKAHVAADGSGEVSIVF